MLCPTLVGHAAPLAFLERALTLADQDGGQTVLLSGEAGIGKSRLVAEVQARAAERGLARFAGQCFERDRAIPWAPFLDLLRTHFRSLPADEARRQLDTAPELVQLLPELAPLATGPAPPPAPEPGQEKLRLFHALARLLTGGPALIVVEDLHWCDEVSLDFLLHFVRPVRSSQTLLLLTYRSDEVPPGLASLLLELDRTRLAHELRLARLSEAEVDAMLRAIFRLDRPVRSDFLQLVYSLTDGNPFFVEEVLASLVATGDVFPTGGRWDRRPVGDLRVPRSVQEAVQRRAALLSAPARELLTLAAVAGRRFDFRLLRAATGRAEDGLVPLVKELVAAGLVVEESADRFAFRHALTRQAILAATLGRERVATHRRVAEAIESLDASAAEARADDLAYHFFEAEMWEPALRYATQAGSRALECHSPRAAIEQLTRAMAAARRLGKEPPPGLHSLRGRAYETVGDFEAALADLDAALAGARTAADLCAEWRARVDLGFLWASRDYRRAGDEFRAGLDLARTVGDPALVAESLNRVGNWQVNVGEAFEGRRQHEEALALYERLGDQRGIAETLDLLGLAAAHGVGPVEGARYYERGAALCRALGDRRGLVTSLAMLAQLRALAYVGADVAPSGGVASAVDQAEESVAVAQEIGWRGGEAFGRASLALALGVVGRYGLALEQGRSSLVIAEEVDHAQWIVGAHLVLGGLYLDLLAPAVARRHVERARALAEEVGSAIFAGQAIAVLSLCHQLGRDLGAAEALLRPALHPDGPTRLGVERLCWRLTAEVALARGEAALALEVADRLIGSLEPGCAPSVVPQLWLLRGQALARLGRFGEAERVLAETVAAAEEDGVRSLLWRISSALGRCLWAQGRRIEAERAFAAARSLIAELAASVPEERVPELGGLTLRSHFVAAAAAMLPRPRPVTPLRAAKAAFGQLTAREREVAELIAAGRSNREIAEALVVGQRTVQTHVANIFAKLGCGSRAEVAAWVATRTARASSE